MSRDWDGRVIESDADERLQQAVDWFLRMRSEGARSEDLSELQCWLEHDPRNALAYQKVSASWHTVGAQGCSPELTAGRRDAMEHARWAAPRRGQLLMRYASAAGVVAACLVSVWIFTRPPAYATELGERRILTLADGSIVTLNARSRIRVDFSEHARLIALDYGQARFDVAKDPARPFQVKARDQTVVTLGTQFDVEILSSAVLVTLIEGQVAVTGVKAPSAGPPGVLEEGVTGRRMPGRIKRGVDGADGMVELTAGQGLRIRPNGEAATIAHVNVAHAMAWQSGKMFFDNEALSSAAERVNRYSRTLIDVDASAAAIEISGVFNAGDAEAFIEAVATYFPVEVTRLSGSHVRLSARL